MIIVSLVPATSNPNRWGMNVLQRGDQSGDEGQDGADDNPFEKIAHLEPPVEEYGFHTLDTGDEGKFRPHQRQKQIIEDHGVKEIEDLEDHEGVKELGEKGCTLSFQARGGKGYDGETHDERQ